MNCFEALIAHHIQESQTRASWFVSAGSTADALAKLGLLSSADKLVVYGKDALSRYQQVLGESCVCAAHEVSAEAFCLASVSTRRTLTEGSPASYAHTPGQGPEHVFWMLDALSIPDLRVPDITSFATAARECGALLLVDISRIGSYGAPALRLGAHMVFEQLGICEAQQALHLVMVSVPHTKRGRGKKQHEDLLAETAYRLLNMRLGDAVEASHEERAFDAHVKKTATAHTREHAQQRFDLARTLAAYLDCHPQINKTIFPGLEHHPDRGHVGRVLEHGAGPLIALQLGDGLEPGCLAENLCLGISQLDASAEHTRLELVQGTADSSQPHLLLSCGTEDALDMIELFEKSLRVVD
ncbi:PLP-dependent transferase [Collinsella sp. zg1085]|uniref:PLP-dependent transferase n=1 Tax=Collinsella sp. zg1085 TaxID=2844380 RepID=UPI001C0E3177|nr:PLP-dependent transferase [Collinsella sp. zg1085]QWT18216.1 PLP-dependent transferase [Collinsella sp. zg1085]